MYKTKETAIRNLRNGKNFGTKPFDLFRSDREVVLEAVKIKPNFILDADSIWNTDSKFRNDIEIMAFVSKRDPSLFQLSSRTLKENKAFCMEVLTHHGSILEYVSSELQSDLEVVETALKSDGTSLNYASDELKNNREMVLLAVSETPFAFQYASERLRADKEILLRALSAKIPKFAISIEISERGCLKHASTEIQELCRDKDPVAALEKALAMEKLQQTLKAKEPSRSIRLKI